MPRPMPASMPIRFRMRSRGWCRRSPRRIRRSRCCRPGWTPLPATTGCRCPRRPRRCCRRCGRTWRRTDAGCGGAAATTGCPAACSREQAFRGRRCTWRSWTPGSTWLRPTVPARAASGRRCHERPGLRFRGPDRNREGPAPERRCLLVREDAGLWVVADGLDGHSAGDHASGLIVQRLAALQRPDDVCDFIDAIDDALEQVNAELLRFAAEREVDLIGSTVVVLVHDPAFMACAWVGDSRVYRWGDGGLRQITADHVHGQKDDETRFNTGPPGGQNAPAPGALTKAVGAQEPLFVDWV